MNNEWIEHIQIPKGYLEILVTDVETGEIIRRDGGRNQVQDWAKHSLAYLQAGRLFSTWGNHGEDNIIDPVTTTIPHYKDGTEGDGTNNVTGSPWTYDVSFEGLIQVRTLGGDDNSSSTGGGDPLYPFFPTKMRFGTGGLDGSQNPITTIGTDSRSLQYAEDSWPFVLVERGRSVNDPHISFGESDNTINKVTFSCRIPGGSGSYPYNGLVISEAGLFCDAGLKVVEEQNVYTEMRTGLMFAYRTFYGITKNESIDVTFRWSFIF